MKDIRVESAVPLPLITFRRCDRSPESFDTIRKFRSDCGNTLEVRITRARRIRSISQVYTCQSNCSQCHSKEQFVRQLIADGK